MENKLPKPARKTYQRKQAVTIAAEKADIVIREFPYQIWIEDDRIYIEKTALTKEKLFHNERELEAYQMHYEAAFREGDSIYFRQGEITIFREELVLCMMEEDYDTIDQLDIERGIAFYQEIHLESEDIVGKVCCE